MIHYGDIRLPDRFQGERKERVGYCEVCGRNCLCKGQEPAQLVAYGEERVKQALAKNWSECEAVDSWIKEAYRQGIKAAIGVSFGI